MRHLATNDCRPERRLLAALLQHAQAGALHVAPPSKAAQADNPGVKELDLQRAAQTTLLVGL